MKASAFVPRKMTVEKPNIVITIVNSYLRTEAGNAWLIALLFLLLNCLPSSNKNSAAVQAPCSTARVSGVISSSSRQSGEAP